MHYSHVRRDSCNSFLHADLLYSYILAIMGPSTVFRTSAGSRAVGGVDLSLTDPVDRVNNLLSFARSGEYVVRPPRMRSVLSQS